MSEKEKAFRLFDEGYRPSEIYSEVKVKPRVIYNYYQEWKKTQQGVRLEAEEEERGMELELEAEERAERLQQEAEQQQEEAEQRVSRQQQEVKQLADKLHAIEMNLEHYRWHPDNLLCWWARPEINKVYPTPEDYLKALEKRRDNLRALIKDKQASFKGALTP